MSPADRVKAWGAIYADTIMDMAETGQAIGRAMKRAREGDNEQLASLNVAAAALIEQTERVLASQPSGDEQFDRTIQAAARSWNSSARKVTGLTGANEESTAAIRSGIEDQDEALSQFDACLARLGELGFLNPD